MGIEAIPGWLTEAEGNALRDLARQVPADQAIVEVGSYMGKSTAYLCEGSRGGDGAHLTCVDPWVGEEIRWYTDATDAEMMDRFRAVIAQGEWGDLVTPLRSSSQLVASIWVQPAGLIFIDADHSYEDAERDFASWAPHVASGGWLAFHDYSAEWPGIVRALDEQSARVMFFGTPNLTDSLWAAQRL